MFFHICAGSCGEQSVTEREFFQYLIPRMKHNVDRRLQEQNVVGAKHYFEKGCPKCLKRQDLKLGTITMLTSTQGATP